MLAGLPHQILEP
ncbi:hypothetical protein LINPERHAP1_LOCUS35004 [Linum perenne]